MLSALDCIHMHESESEVVSEFYITGTFDRKADREVCKHSAEGPSPSQLVLAIAPDVKWYRCWARLLYCAT